MKTWLIVAATLIGVMVMPVGFYLRDPFLVLGSSGLMFEGARAHRRNK